MMRRVQDTSPPNMMLSPLSIGRMSCWRRWSKKASVGSTISSTHMNGKRVDRIWEKVDMSLFGCTITLNWTLLAALKMSPVLGSMSMKVS